MIMARAFVGGVVMAAASAASAAAAAPAAGPFVPFENLTVVESPSLARAALAVERLQPPARGQDVSVECAVNAPGGSLSCLAKTSTDLAMARAAYILVAGYRVKTDGLPPGARTRVTVRLTPPPLDLVRGDQQPLPFSAFDFVKAPSGGEVAADYPPRAQDLGKAGRAQVICRVLPDFSLACPEVEEAPADFGFGEATQRVALLFRVSPMMKDGQPAVGKWLKFAINFNLAAPAAPARKP